MKAPEALHAGAWPLQYGYGSSSCFCLHGYGFRMHYQCFCLFLANALLILKSVSHWPACEEDSVGTPRTNPSGESRASASLSPLQTPHKISPSRTTCRQQRPLPSSFAPSKHVVHPHEHFSPLSPSARDPHHHLRVRPHRRIRRHPLRSITRMDMSPDLHRNHSTEPQSLDVLPLELGG